jgi:CDP-diacylglycerol---glycerol-3-phosphate 3-phosphatidyltransferase
VREPGVPHR